MTVYSVLHVHVQWLAGVCVYLLHTIVAYENVWVFLCSGPFITRVLFFVLVVHLLL